MNMYVEVDTPVLVAVSIKVELGCLFIHLKIHFKLFFLSIYKVI